MKKLAIVLIVANIVCMLFILAGILGYGGIFNWMIWKILVGVIAFIMYILIVYFRTKM